MESLESHVEEKSFLVLYPTKCLEIDAEAVINHRMNSFIKHERYKKLKMMLTVK